MPASSGTSKANVLEIYQILEHTGHAFGKFDEEVRECVGWNGANERRANGQACIDLWVAFDTGGRLG